MYKSIFIDFTHLVCIHIHYMFEMDKHTCTYIYIHIYGNMLTVVYANKHISSLIHMYIYTSICILACIDHLFYIHTQKSPFLFCLTSTKNIYLNTETYNLIKNTSISHKMHVQIYTHTCTCPMFIYCCMYTFIRVHIYIYMYIYI